MGQTSGFVLGSREVRATEKVRWSKERSGKLRRDGVAACGAWCFVGEEEGQGRSPLDLFTPGVDRDYKKLFCVHAYVRKCKIRLILLSQLNNAYIFGHIGISLF